MNAVEVDQKERELVAWGATLREQGERLAEQVALLLDRVADTEERVAEAFARRAVVSPHRAPELCCYAWQAQAVAERLRTGRQR